MVVGRMLRLAASSRTAGTTSQQSPISGAKALVGLVLLFGLFRLLPHEMTNKWLAWAQTPEGMRNMWVGFLSVVAAVSLIKAVLDSFFDGSVWKRLRFQPNPKTRPHHAGALIWLHGVGDSGAGFQWLRCELTALGVKQVKVVLPDGPMRALQAAGGRKKRAWFGLESMPVSLEVTATPHRTVTPLRCHAAPRPLCHSSFAPHHSCTPALPRTASIPPARRPELLGAGRHVRRRPRVVSRARARADRRADRGWLAGREDHRRRLLAGQHGQTPPVARHLHWQCPTWAPAPSRGHA